MISPHKKIMVYDLETGGLDHTRNQITELALVTICLETLTITEEFSRMIHPIISFKAIELEPYKEAKAFIKALAVKVEGHAGKVLMFKEQALTLKNYKALEEELEDFYDVLEESGKEVFTWEEYQPLLNGEFGELAKLYIDMNYNPQALEVTKIPFEMLLEEGLPYEQVLADVMEEIESATDGNSKPLISGHNIKKFDNKFFFPMLGMPLADALAGKIPRIFNQDILIDTLDFARLKWFELSNFTLGSCVNGIGQTLSGAHRALPDTIANAQLVVAMMKALRGEGSQQSKYERRKYDFNL